MNPLLLARWQFGITTVYHFFFVSLTLGLSILVALMETLYVRTGDETYKRMTIFWGRPFLFPGIHLSGRLGLRLGPALQEDAPGDDLAGGPGL